MKLFTFADGKPSTRINEETYSFEQGVWSNEIDEETKSLTKIANFLYFINANTGEEKIEKNFHFEVDTSEDELYKKIISGCSDFYLEKGSSLVNVMDLHKFNQLKQIEIKINKYSRHERTHFFHLTLNSYRIFATYKEEEKQIEIRLSTHGTYYDGVEEREAYSEEILTENNTNHYHAIVETIKSHNKVRLLYITQ